MVSELSPMTMHTRSPCFSSSSLPMTGKTNVISFNQPISVKLDDKNFLLWKQQILYAISGHELEKFIEGPNSWPQKYDSSEKEAAGEVSDEFKRWKKQDQLLVSWILSSMTETLLTSLSNLGASPRIFCISDEARSVNSSWSYVTLRRVINPWMNIYSKSNQASGDALTSIGNPVTTGEHIEFILALGRRKEQLM